MNGRHGPLWGVMVLVGVVAALADSELIGWRQRA